MQRAWSLQRTVHGAFWAVCLSTLQTLLAVTTAVVLVAPAYTITFLEIFNIWTEFFNNANAFVAKGHVILVVVDW